MGTVVRRWPGPARPRTERDRGPGEFKFSNLKSDAGDRGLMVYDSGSNSLPGRVPVLL